MWWSKLYEKTTVLKAINSATSWAKDPKYLYLNIFILQTDMATHFFCSTLPIVPLHKLFWKHCHLPKPQGYCQGCQTVGYNQLSWFIDSRGVYPFPKLGDNVLWYFW